MSSFQMTYQYELVRLWGRWRKTVSGEVNKQIPDRWASCSNKQVRKLIKILLREYSDPIQQNIDFLHVILGLKRQIWDIIGLEYHADLPAETKFLYEPIQWNRDRFRSPYFLFHGSGDILHRFNLMQLVFADAYYQIYTQKRTRASLIKCVSVTMCLRFCRFRPWMSYIARPFLWLSSRNRLESMAVNYGALRNSFSAKYRLAFEREMDAIGRISDAEIEGMKGLRIDMVDKFGHPRMVDRTNIHDIFTELVARKVEYKNQKRNATRKRR